MPRQLVLITGGAGFIGSHVCDELLERGYQVRVLDCLDPQIHARRDLRPPYLSRDVELIRGDLRERNVVAKALHRVDRVVHLAAAVGVGQSMYQMARYTSVNDLGTAVLLDALIESPVERLVVASSMSIYGEGCYRDAAGNRVVVSMRGREQLERGEWDALDADGKKLVPVPTPESKVPEVSSVYALNKLVQERMCLIFGDAYRVPTVALRFFNVYGPRQALSNPYTGVLAIFSARLMAGERPAIFEDGQQQRDFVNVHDVARACRLALERPAAAGHVFNIGSGRPVSILEVAEEIADVLNCREIEPDILGKYRAGDIRHCFADIAKARALLGYEPKVTFSRGLKELAEWLANQEVVEPTATQRARDELVERGLVV
jgi:dTDP-L-rhamnose 4-epimerase